MSASTVLARKWRPHQFSEVVGQEPVVRALSQALTSGRLHHAYLFTGTRGVGKTTLARIFAKALNCRAGASAEPCHDDIAQAIDAGHFVDLIEIDAASRTKVEDTRELLDNVQYAPSVGRYKIYIIDEVHMLSTHSFNALLKTLEEPPEHVKFLLATTDPHKLPVTILSRCLQFHLRPMTPMVLHAHLAKVLTAEGIAFDRTALDLVVRMSGGSVRDALSLLDQAIMLGAGQVLYASTRDMLGLASDEQVNQLIHALSQSDADAALALLNEWAQWGADFDRLQQQLLEKLHQLAMLQSFARLSQDADSAMVALANQVSSEQVQLWLQIVLLAQDDMRLAPTAQMGFELMLMRLLHFVAVVPSSTVSLPAPVAKQSMLASSSVPVASSVSTSSVVREPAISPPPVIGDDAAALPPHLAALAALGIQKKTETAEKKTPKLAEAPVFVAPTATRVEAVVAPSAIAEVSPTASTAIPHQPWALSAWQACLDQWQLKGPELELARQCLRLQASDDAQIHLAYPASEQASIAYWGDKLAQAIAQVQKGAQLHWHNVWSDQWLSPELHQQQVVHQQQLAARAVIEAEPRFQQLSQSLGLTAQWAQLIRLPMASEVR